MEITFVKIVSWFLAALTTCGVSIMTYNFLTLLFMDNKYKKLICGGITAIIIISTIIIVLGKNIF